MSLRTACLATLLAPLVFVPSIVAVAQEPPQGQRQALMKANGDASKILGAMAKGEQPFDAAVADREFDGMLRDIRQFVTLFPDGTETGHKTRARPEIWSDRATFDARAEDMVTAVTAARETTAQGLDAFRPAFARVGQSCGGCHESFRMPQS